MEAALVWVAVGGDIGALQHGTQRLFQHVQGNRPRQVLNNLPRFSWKGSQRARSIFVVRHTGPPPGATLMRLGTAITCGRWLVLQCIHRGPALPHILSNGLQI